MYEVYRKNAKKGVIQIRKKVVFYVGGRVVTYDPLTLTAKNTKSKLPYDKIDDKCKKNA